MDNAQARPFTVRRAAVADAAALTRLREAMLSDMGMLAAGADPGWREKAEAWFAQRLDDKDDFAAFVIEHPDLGVVSCAAGVCDRHAPGPGNPGGVQGLIFNMSTDPRCRRRGYARACLDALPAQAGRSRRQALARRRRSAACVLSASPDSWGAPNSACSRALYAAIHTLAAHAISCSMAVNKRPRTS